jgi:hypothetical protein
MIGAPVCEQSFSENNSNIFGIRQSALKPA